jgi:PAS domain S-box-containing protein
MAPETTAPIALHQAVGAAQAGEGASEAGSNGASSFFRRLGERGRPDDVAALLIEEAATALGCRRALYLGTEPKEGALTMRLAIGFDPGVRVTLPLAADDCPLVAAALRGKPVPLDARGLLGCGLPADAFSDPPPANGAMIPVPGLPLMGSGKGDLAPRCRLFLQESVKRPRCFLRKEFHNDPQIPEPWDVRIRTVCCDCSFFGVMGLLLVEREAPFAAEEIERLMLYAMFAGQRIRAVESVDRLEKLNEKLRKDREWLDTVMVSAADPIIVTDDRGELVLQNKRAEDLLVATQEDSAGKRRAIGINDITFSAYLSSLSIDPKRVPRELPLVHPIEGSDLLFEAITTPAFGSTGQRLGAVTVLRDITDLQKATLELYQQVYKAQRAEATIREERDRLNQIVKSAVEPIVVTNQTNEIVITNSEGERLFQSYPEDTPARQRAVRNNDAYFSSFLTDFMADAEVQRKREIRLIDPMSDELRTFEVTAGKVRGERGQSMAVVSVFHDLTKLMELERRRLEQKLFESEKLAATGRLAASIAHEMNNPLESIKNSLFILKGRVASDESTAKFLDVAQRECERVANIVKQFLGFYRPAMTMVPVAATAILEDELKLVESQLQKRRIEVHRRYGAHIPKIIANEDQLKQVFLNLILNALEAMPKSGTLGVGTKLERGVAGPVVRITISDTGSGIASEHMPQIFEPFFTTKSEKGTGLGLWVSYGIVKAHKGEIKVETEPGVGTQFHIILPAFTESEGARDGHGG